MHKDLWVIDVLRDIGDFANDRGYYRLVAAMETARDDFLKDHAEQEAQRATAQGLETQDIAIHHAIVPLRKKYGH